MRVIFVGLLLSVVVAMTGLVTVSDSDAQTNPTVTPVPVTKTPLPQIVDEYLPVVAKNAAFIQDVVFPPD